MINSPVPAYPSLTKFTAFVELKDFRGPTKKEYVRYVRKLAEHHQCGPLALSEDQLRAYFLFLRQQKQFGGPSGYESLKVLCESALGQKRGRARLDYWQDYHAQLVMVGKHFCRPREPRCELCPLRSLLPGGENLKTEMLTR